MHFFSWATHSDASLVEGGDWKGIAGVLVHIRAGISLVPMGSPVSPVDPVVRSRVKRPGNQVGYKTAMAELKHQPDNHLKDSIQRPSSWVAIGTANAIQPSGDSFPHTPLLERITSYDSKWLRTAPSIVLPCSPSEAHLNHLVQVSASALSMASRWCSIYGFSHGLKGDFVEDLTLINKQKKKTN